MKNFKIIAIVLCIALTFVYACTTDEDSNSPENTALVTNVIGVHENGEFHLDNQEALKTKWEQRLSEQGYDVTLEQFDFVNGDFDGNGKSNTILMASNAEGTVKIATKITLGERDSNRISPVIAGENTVTCTGCRVGCSPEDNETHGWICTSCVVGNDCVKTESTGG